MISDRDPRSEAVLGGGAVTTQVLRSESWGLRELRPLAREPRAFNQHSKGSSDVLKKTFTFLTRARLCKASSGAHAHTRVRAHPTPQQAGGLARGGL